MNKMDNNAPHIPVLLSEMLLCLEPKSEEAYLDCTFGAGGYSKAILASANCSVTALDRDLLAAEYAQELAKESDRFHFVHTDFAQSSLLLEGKKFNGIVMDLGVSSMQLDTPSRGFSFMKDGPLDMRMGTQAISAADFIASASEEEIADVIYKYGEEPASRKIARAIVSNRKITPIDTTFKLAEIVRACVKFRGGLIDPATKTFQAIRIWVNKELQQLEDFLDQAKDLLLPGGRIIIVSFHSLEDSIVKSFFKEHSPKHVARSKYAKVDEQDENSLDENIWLKILTKKPISPTEQERKQNMRSRSAKLRAAIRIRGGNVI